MEFLIGIFVGALLFYIFTERKKSSGVFIIDFSNPMDDMPFRIEMHDDLNSIYSKKQIILKVKTIDEDISH